jgi:hypothetical protein
MCGSVQNPLEQARAASRQHPAPPAHTPPTTAAVTVRSVSAQRNAVGLNAAEEDSAPDHLRELRTRAAAVGGTTLQLATS